MRVRPSTLQRELAALTRTGVLRRLQEGRRIEYQADPDCPITVARPGAKPGDSFLNLNVTPQGQASGVLVKRYVG